jgi:hypothetical protein
VRKGAQDLTSYISHMFALLGTPSIMKYESFSALPLASALGDKVFDPHIGKHIQTRCRLVKSIKAECFEAVHHAFFIRWGGPDLSLFGHVDQLEEEEYGNSAVLALVQGLHLNPARRLPLSDILRLEFFSRPHPLSAHDELERVRSLVRAIR